MSNFRWGAILAIVAFVASILLGLISGVGIIYILLRAVIFAVVFFGLGFGLKFMINSFFPELLYTGDGTSEYGGAYEEPAAPDIIIDNTGEYAVPELYKNQGDPNELGNIEDLISGSFKPRAEGVDRKPEEGYNNIGRVQSVAAAAVEDDDSDFLDTAVFEKPSPVEKPEFIPSLGEDSAGFEGLPDLDSMAVAFSNSEEADEEVQDRTAKKAEAFSFGDDDIFGSIPEGIPGASTDQFMPQESENLEKVRTVQTGNKPQPLKGGFEPKELAEGIRTVLSKDQ